MCRDVSALGMSKNGEENWCTPVGDLAFNIYVSIR